MKRSLSIVFIAIGIALSALAGTTVKLENVNSDKTIADGTTLKGVLGGKAKLSIAEGATVTLDDVTIANTTYDGSHSAGLTCLGDATIILKSDTENVIRGYSGYPGIYVPKGNTLTIKGGGCLYAHGGDSAAGIGGGDELAKCGNIVIERGEIHAYAGRYAAAIGAGEDKSCGDITITGGKIEAKGWVDGYIENRGNGIGNGTGANSKCGNVYINGGDIQAVSSMDYPIGKKCKSVKVGSGVGKLDLISAGGGAAEVVLTDIVGNDYKQGFLKWDDHLTQAGPYKGYGGRISSWGFISGEIIEDGFQWRTVRITSYLGRLTGSKTINNGDYVTGELLGDYKISLAKDATVVFDNVKIGDNLESDMPGVTCASSGTNIIVVQGDSYIKGHGECYPGIFVPEDCMLEIRTVVPDTIPQSIGSLTVTSGGSGGAGIGGCHPDICDEVDRNNQYAKPCGRVVIYGGRITAKGGARAAAIGGRFKKTKNSSTIEAHGHVPAFFGGTITVKGGVNMRPFDRDDFPELNDYVVVYENYDDEYDENVYMRSLREEPGGDDAQKFIWNGSLSALHRNTGCVEAYGGTFISGVMTCGTKIFIVSDATVTLGNAGIHSPESYVKEDGEIVCRRGDYAGLTCEGDATIVLKSDSQSVIRLDKNKTSDNPKIKDRGYYPAIYVPEGKTLTIDGDGGLVVAGGEHAAGLGAGYNSKRSCGKIEIKNGVITSIGGKYAFGIGSGDGGKCDGVSILGGLVIAIADREGEAPIGSSTDLELEISDSLEMRDVKAGDYYLISGASRYSMQNDDFWKYLISIHHWNWNNEFTIYNDQRCSIIGTGEDISKRRSSGFPQMLSARPGTAPRLLGGGSWTPDIPTIGKHYCDAIAGDGFVLTGTLEGRCKFAIADGATVTLKDVTIGGDGHDDSSPYAGLTCLGSATLILEGTNTITSFHGRYPGIFVPTNGTLCIKGSGALIANSAGYGAGIGGGYQLDCGKIVISNGTVTARGGTYAAGIGGGYYASCKGVVIGPGIGRVVAERGSSGADIIGAGDGGTCSTLIVSQVLTAVDSGNERTLQWNGSIQSIHSVSDDTLELTANDGTTISGSTYGTSGDKKVKIMIAAGAHVTLREATINKSRAPSADTPWAGITCLGDATITIEDRDGSLVKTNTVKTFNTDYPAIFVPGGSTLTIEGDGTLEASNRNGTGGAGIGGGSTNDTKWCGRIVVNGGNVTAYGGSAASGIGGGNNGSCDGVLIGASITHVKAVCGDEGTASALGYGNNGECDTIEVASGIKETYGSHYREFTGNPDVDLSTLSGDKVISTGALVTGELPGTGQYKISVAPGAEITLNNVHIVGKEAGINCQGNATIWLEGNDSTVSGADGYPGIYVPSGSTLTIKARNLDSRIWAAGGSYSAGIGAGRNNAVRTCGNIVIEGGTVFGNGQGGAAGIGTAYSAELGYSSVCQGISITGGLVMGLTYGGTGGAGIGSGKSGQCGDITIGPGITEVIAIRDSSSAEYVGRGDNGACGTVTVDPAIVCNNDPSDLDASGTNTQRYFPNPDVNLSSLGGGDEVVVKDGATISGTLGVNRKISIAAGATVTLDNAAITNGSNAANYRWAGLTCQGNATIILVGENAVKGFHQNHPGIYIPKNRTLTIKGTGSLDASSNGHAAGIGGGYTNACGNIVIEGGTITATGGSFSPGIGGGNEADCGDITIKGGRVASTGGASAAGIGCGYQASCGKISIIGDVERVVATGGQSTYGHGKGSPIGLSAKDGSCTGITVGGTLIDVTDGDTRTIMSKNVDLANVTSDFTIYNGMTVAGTLGGNYKVSIAAGAHITLNQAIIQGENNSGYPWAGLTCLGDATVTLRNYSMIKGFYTDYPGIYVPTNCTLTINGTGALRAESNGWAAGIGAGFDMACGDIVIDGGSITARGGTYASGIGGSNADCGDITINGGTVWAYGGSRASAIGAGFASACGTVTVGAGITSVTATLSDSTPGDHIGKGYDNPYGEESTCAGVVVADDIYDATNGLTRTLTGPTIVDLSTLTSDVTLSNRFIVVGTLLTPCQISIADGATVKLRNADINGAGDWTSRTYAGLTCLGDATIVIEDTNKVRGFGNNYAGIFVPSGKTLTIEGDGALEAHSGAPEDKQHVMSYFGAGIGCNGDASCGSIVIESGTVYARGGGGIAAGIGCPVNVSPAVLTAGAITIGEDVKKVVADGGISAYTKAESLVATSKTEDNRTTVVVRQPWDGDLSTYEADTVITDGTILTGSLRSESGVTLDVESGATITLDNAYIDGQLHCLGRATIILSGENTISAPSGKPAIQTAGYDEEATIKGRGSLIAISDESWLWGYYGFEDNYRVSNIGNTYTISRDVGVAATTAIQAWATANGVSISGDWDAQDAHGVANVFRYVFDRVDDAFTENNIIIGFETDGNGAVAVQTLPVVNGKNLFSFAVVASDNPDGTGYVMEYPLSLVVEENVSDEQGNVVPRSCVTVIDEPYNPSRFFRIKIDLAR